MAVQELVVRVDLGAVGEQGAVVALVDLGVVAGVADHQIPTRTFHPAFLDLGEAQVTRVRGIEF